MFAITFSDNLLNKFSVTRFVPAQLAHCFPGSESIMPLPIICHHSLSRITLDLLILIMLFHITRLPMLSTLYSTFNITVFSVTTKDLILLLHFKVDLPKNINQLS